MTNIQLTEEHKSKLLEMCKELFPEIKYWSFDDQMLDVGSYIPGVNENRISNHLFLSKLKEAPFDDGIFIHWFEFCMEICQRLAITNPMMYVAFQTNFNYVVVHYKFWNKNDNKIHPVDYLYEEFLKLKK